MLPAGHSPDLGVLVVGETKKSILTSSLVPKQMEIEAFGIALRRLGALVANSSGTPPLYAALLQH
jgi:hypothetical protein